MCGKWFVYNNYLVGVCVGSTGYTSVLSYLMLSQDVGVGRTTLAHPRSVDHVASRGTGDAGGARARGTEGAVATP